MSTEHSPQGALPLSEDLGMKMSNQEASGGWSGAWASLLVCSSQAAWVVLRVQKVPALKMAAVSTVSAVQSDLCRGPECLGDFAVSLRSQD